MDAQQLRALQKAARAVFVDPALIEYAVRVAAATRTPASVGLHDMARYITYGVSPRASINMVLAAQALALVRGRQYVLPEDVRTSRRMSCATASCSPTRRSPTTSAPNDILAAILARVPLPEVVLRDAST